MKAKRLLWTEELFRKIVKPIDIDRLSRRIRDSLGEEELPTEMDLDKNYILSQDLFGVKIENGLFRVTRCITEDAVKMFDDFVEIYESRKGLTFEVRQDFERLFDLAKRWGMELPDEGAVQGYIMNHELIHFMQGEYTVLQMKYKDNPENIFYLYKFYFTQIKEDLYLVIEKNI